MKYRLLLIASFATNLAVAGTLTYPAPHHRADVVCKAAEQKADGIYVLLWRRSQGVGYNAEIEIKGEKAKYEFDELRKIPGYPPRIFLRGKREQYPHLIFSGDGSTMLVLKGTGWAISEDYKLNCVNLD